MIPRGNLPEINFAEKSPKITVTEAIAVFEKLSEETLAPADPRRVFIESLCYIIAQQRVIIDFSAKMNLLSYATGEYLDVLGYLLSVTRLPAQSAVTTQQFELEAAQISAYVIPAGAQVTTGSSVFETTEILEIPIGTLTGVVPVRAVNAGAEGNGLLPGQINTLITPLPYIKNVTNLTTTSGGADVEKDDNFAERIHLAPASFSVAGPEDAYKYWTRTANQGIKSVSVNSPTPGVVDVRFLMAGGIFPSQEVMDEVNNVLNAKTIRPLTDKVNVLLPNNIDYKINIEYWISNDNKTQADLIQKDVKKAVDNFAIWQRSEFGRDINPDMLNNLVVSARAKRVNIISPKFTVLEKIDVAQDNDITITFKGLEDG